MTKETSSSQSSTISQSTLVDLTFAKLGLTRREEATTRSFSLEEQFKNKKLTLSDPRVRKAVQLFLAKAPPELPPCKKNGTRIMIEDSQIAPAALLWELMRQKRGLFGSAHLEWFTDLYISYLERPHRAELNHVSGLILHRLVHWALHHREDLCARSWNQLRLETRGSICVGHRGPPLRLIPLPDVPHVDWSYRTAMVMEIAPNFKQAEYRASFNKLLKDMLGSRKSRRGKKVSDLAADLKKVQELDYGAKLDSFQRKEARRVAKRAFSRWVATDDSELPGWLMAS